MKILQCRDKQLKLNIPHVMGVLNVTPDSFSDGGCFFSPEKAVERGLQMIAEGASIIDVGGESTRPGANPVEEQEEIDRILPVLQALRKETDVIISIDTRKPEVIRQSILNGADLINDVSALKDPEIQKFIASTRVAVCLMHMQGDPQSMQQNPFYSNIMATIKDFFRERITSCLANGMQKDQIIIDPGFGYGKTTAHNWLMLKYLAEFQEIGQPILVGISRKFSIGEILKKPVDQRLYGSIAAHVIAALHGATIIRAHDIKPTVEALTIVSAVLSQE